MPRRFKIHSNRFPDTLHELVFRPGLGETTG
jgi:hypothetical protein